MVGRLYIHCQPSPSFLPFFPEPISEKTLPIPMGSGYFLHHRKFLFIPSSVGLVIK